MLTLHTPQRSLETLRALAASGRSGRNFRFSPAAQSLICELAASGVSLTAIGEAANCHRNVVRRCLKRSGDDRRPTLEDRFWSRVIGREDPEACWPWMGCTEPRSGYGRASLSLADGRKLHLAHRVALYIATGVVPSSTLDVMHSCDNRLCCNPAHLSVGTRTDNMRDAARKGRTVFGERNHLASLTEPEVSQIKRLLADGLRPKDVAPRFGRCRQTIEHIKYGRSWVRTQPARTTEALRKAVRHG